MKGGGHRETWTVGMLTRMRELHAAGMTFGQIARALNAEFGTAVTRNACVGKGRRLQLPARKAPEMISAEERQRAVFAAKIARRRAKASVTKPNTVRGAPLPPRSWATSGWSVTKASDCGST